MPFFMYTTKVGWLGCKHVVFCKVKKGTNTVKTRVLWVWQTPGLARLLRSSPLLHVDSSNKFDSYFILTTDHSFSHLLIIAYILCALMAVFWVLCFPYPLQVSLNYRVEFMIMRQKLNSNK